MKRAVILAEEVVIYCPSCDQATCIRNPEGELWWEVGRLPILPVVMTCNCGGRFTVQRPKMVRLA